MGMAQLPIADRIGLIAPSITLQINDQVKRLKESGSDVISFCVGEPNFPTPPAIAQVASQAALDPANHRYTATKGLPEFRQAIAAKTLRDSGYQVDPENIVVTNGGKQAVYEAFQAVVNPGDQVIVPAPYWVSYTEAIKLAGGEPVVVPFGAEQGFEPTVDGLEAARTDKTKAIILNSPSNPTGAVWSARTMAEIASWAKDHGIWVISDEIYEHMVYDGAQTAYIGAVAPEIRDQLIVLNGLAKTYAMTGWRVGWLIGPPAVASAAAKLQGHMTSNVNNVAQRAGIAALEGDLSAVARMRSAFDIRRKAMVQALNGLPGVSCDLPRGAFYVFPDVTGLLGRPVGPRRTVCPTSVDLAKTLLDQALIAAVPGEGFGMPGHIRFSCALSDEDLAEGMRRLTAWVTAAGE
ncbi:aminotransferase, class I/II [Parascardovia denticolens DSM 10105 = JCM 12538]|uniref:Aminotransferase n=2 Tax=Parascardovia denticolens TaxID=78258 RepID=E6K2Z4_PARDN|nr:aminotransferase, class I/II [Parascardovia denticolens DSM 10105 = JCM 12538]